jgi:hypothetical protein
MTALTADQQARIVEIAEHAGVTGTWESIIAQCIRAALSDELLTRAVRDEAIEECAKVCEAENKRWQEVSHCEAEMNASADCAAAIRALASGEKKGG